jgi:hypothetical protein
VSKVVSWWCFVFAANKRIHYLASSGCISKNPLADKIFDQKHGLHTTSCVSLNVLMQWCNICLSTRRFQPWPMSHARDCTISRASRLPHYLSYTHEGSSVRKVNSCVRASTDELRVHAGHSRFLGLHHGTVFWNIIVQDLHCKKRNDIK